MRKQKGRSAFTAAEWAILAMLALLVFVVFVVGGLLVWQGFNTGKSQPIQITVIVSPTAPPSSPMSLYPTFPPTWTPTYTQPPKPSPIPTNHPVTPDPCFIDLVIGRQYNKVFSDSSTTLASVNIRLTDVITANTNGQLSAQDLLVELDAAIPQLESVYTELEAANPPSIMSGPHSKLLNGLLLQIEAIKALRTYKETLDATYAEQAKGLMNAATLLINEASAENDRLAKECGYSPF